MLNGPLGKEEKKKKIIEKANGYLSIWYTLYMLIFCHVFGIHYILWEPNMSTKK